MLSHTRKCSPRPSGGHYCETLLRWNGLRSYGCLTSPSAPAPARCPPGVYVLGWHDLCVPIFRACGNHYALAVVALLRGVQVSPSLPWPSSPTRPRLPSRPGSHLVCAPHGFSARTRPDRRCYGSRVQPKYPERDEASRCSAGTSLAGCERRPGWSSAPTAGSRSAVAKPGRSCASTPAAEPWMQRRSSTASRIIRSSSRWSRGDGVMADAGNACVAPTIVLPSCRLLPDSPTHRLTDFRLRLTSHPESPAPDSRGPCHLQSA